MALWQEVDALFVEYEEIAENPARACILGMHGMGGLGKTTLSKVLFNYYWSRFEGRVIRVELDNSPSKKRTLKRLLMVLKTIQNRWEEILEEILESLHDVDEAWFRYSYAIGWKKVFIIIDNANLECMEEIRKYVERDFQKGSRVLIFSRSKELLRILRSHDQNFHQNLSQNFHIVKMLPLRKEEAESIFRRNFLPSSNAFLDYEIVSYIVSNGIELCIFENFFHPMAVAIIASLINTKGQEDWKAWIQYLSKNRASELGKPMIRLLKISFDDMEEVPQRILFDLALYLPSPQLKLDPYEWLSYVNDMHRTKLNDVLAELRNRAFLCDDGLEIHELVKELAIVATRKNTSLGCVYFHKNNQPWERLGDANGKNVQRFAMKMCQADISTLDLTHCHCLRAIKINDTQGLETIQMGRNMKGLRSLEVRLSSEFMTGLRNEHQRKRKRKRSENIVIKGWVCCDKLKWMCLQNCIDSLMQCSVGKRIEYGSLCILRMTVEETFPFPLQSLRKCCNCLQELKLSGFDVGESCDVSNFSQLRSLDLFRSISTRKLQLGSLLTLEKLTIDRFPKLTLVNRDLEGYWGFETLPSLQTLCVWRCPGVVRMEGLENLNRLDYLDVACCGELVSLFERAVKGEDEETASCLVNLDGLHIVGNPKLKDVSAIANLVSLDFFVRVDIIKYVQYFNGVLSMWMRFFLLFKDLGSSNDDWLNDDKLSKEIRIYNESLNESAELFIDYDWLSGRSKLFNQRCMDDNWLNESSGFFNERSILRWKREFIELVMLQPETIADLPCGIPYHRIFTFFNDHRDSFTASEGTGLFKMLIVCRSSQEERTKITNQLLSSKPSMTQYLSFMPHTQLLICLVYLWCNGQVDSFNMILEMVGGLESLEEWDCPPYNDGKESKIMHGIFILTVGAILWQSMIPLTRHKTLPNLIATKIAKRYSSILLDVKIVLDKRDRMKDMSYHLEDTWLPLHPKNALLRLLDEENVQRKFRQHINHIEGFDNTKGLDRRLRSQPTEYDQDYLLEIVPTEINNEYPYPLYDSRSN